MSYDSIVNIFMGVFLPTIAFIAIAVVATQLVARYIAKLRVTGQVTLITAFATVGGTFGVIIGASRTTGVGVILPALLTIITVLLGYWSGKDGLSEWRPVIPYCLVILMLTAFFGLFSGAIIRSQHEQYEKDYEKRMLYYKQVELEVEKTRKLNELKKTSASNYSEDKRNEGQLPEKR